MFTADFGNFILGKTVPMVQFVNFLIIVYYSATVADFADTAAAQD